MTLGRRLRLVAVAVSIATASLVSAENERSTVVFRAQKSLAGAGSLTLRSRETPQQAREIALGELMPISETPGSTWDVALTSDLWWIPPLTITFPPPGVTQEQQLKLWRTGVVTGKVTTGGKDLQIPKIVSLEVESPPFPSRTPEISRGTRFECPVSDDGKWSCRMPATTLDLALRNKGITPHYRWNVEVSPTQPKDLGTLVLRKGASFIAWLDRKTMKATAKSHARARLVRSVSEEASATTARLRVPVAEAEFSDLGVVQLAPLPAGIYLLEVAAPGFATTRIGPLEIFEGKETSFRRVIELHPPLVVTLRVEPPTDPSGAPWRTEWQRMSDLVSGHDEGPPVRGSVDERGMITIPDQAPGTFSLQVDDVRGNHLQYAEFRIHDETDANLVIRVNVHKLRGKVTLGDDALKATLWFGTLHGAEKIQIDSNEEGAFEGYLPRPGKWPVDVVSQEPLIRTIVDVTVPDDDKNVDIHLPDTRVSGWVVGTDNKRVTRGTVTLAASSHSLPVNVAEDGSFTFRALPVGRVALSGRDLRTGEMSRAVVMELTDGEHRDGVELRIDPSRDVKGRVISRGQPVIGARVRGLTIDPQMKPGGKTVTDVEGRFTLQLNAGSRRALIVVAAPGKTLHSFEVPIGEEPVALDVAPVGGTLELVVNVRFRVFRDGVNIPEYELFDWMMAHGEPLSEKAPLRIADLAPGQYQLCSVAAQPACKSGMLTPGGSLRLELP